MNPPPPDVIELMERIRREEQAPRLNGEAPPAAPRLELPLIAAPLPPAPQPALAPAPPAPAADTVPLWEALTDLVARARSKITVGAWLPAWLRPLARNQGGYNGIMLEAIERLGEGSRELQERMQEQSETIETLRADLRAQNAWLQGLVAARESDLAWMRAVEPYLQRGLAESEAHRQRAEQGESRLASRLAKIEEQNQYTRSDLDQLGTRTGYQETHAARLDERLGRLQSQADEQTGRLREQAARENNMSRHLGDLQRHAERQDAHFTQVHGQLDYLVQRVDQFGDPSADLQRLANSQNQHNEQVARHLADLQRQTDGQNQQKEQVARHLGDLQRQTDGQSQHNERVAQHLSNLQRQHDWQEENLRRAESWQENLAAATQRLDERQVADAGYLKSQLALLGRLFQRQLDPAENHAGSLPSEGSAPEGSRLQQYQEHELDAFYLAFENRFRGSRETIKEQSAVHLAAIEAARARGAAGPVLDLGCGRGEWLELLRERGFAAAGVDRNESMIAQCRERGLEVAAADVMDYLHGLPDASQGALTAFHLIEHLPFRALARLVHECHRVLQPGGVVIFETPNPDNIVVGATEFWGDFTHQRPVLPASVAFLVEQAGFAEARILPLHPVPEPPDPHPEPRSAVWERVHGLLYGPRDYALVAAKACTS